MGDSRITTLPGLQPSARSLKEGADVRERATKRLERERKDPKGEKKSKCRNDFTFILNLTRIIFSCQE